jgi:hypothetical protein
MKQFLERYLAWLVGITYFVIIGLVVFIGVFISLNACAEEIPKSFVYQYNEQTQIILLPDLCVKSDVSQGWQAEAKDSVKHADGCWQYSKDNQTVIIQLDMGEGHYVDFQLFKDKFKPVY